MKERNTTAGIVRQDGRLLIAKRTEGGPVGGLWEFVGGKCRNCETPEEALVREFEEELGIPVSVGKLLATHTFENNETRYHLHAYEVKRLDARPMTLSVHTEIAWVSRSELDRYPFPPSDQAIIAQLF
ncbi:MAG: (deoxy)nucleoside triphosphate pyrophosphohydrolase [Spirochaetales bacterium]|nr:(deoxy)nucleoside triphosphate pyrophosphohydrolase [Spirochaetales bacterium]